MVVEVELPKRDIDDPKTLVNDLLGELVKVKTGAYENRFYADITSVEVLAS